MFVRNFAYDCEFLLDLQEDPDELVNYVDHGDYTGVLTTMWARCNELRDAYGGPYAAPAAA